MPPASNVTSPDPSHTHTALPLAAATDSSSGTNTTPIIIGVSVGAGCLVLLITAYKLWKYIARRSKAPLPPKGPLAHDRERQMAPVYPRSDVGHPPYLIEAPQPFANAAQFDDHIPSDRFDDTSVPPPSPSVMSSQVHLVQTPTGSEENVGWSRPGHASFSSTSTVRQYHHSHRQRSLSASGSVHSNRSRQSLTNSTIRGRGPPHARHSRVDVVLPQPLAPGLHYGNNAPRHSRLPSRSRASSHERRSESREEARTSMDGPPLLPTEIYNPHLGQYPPPVPPLPTNYHAITSTTSPTVSSPNSSDVISPTSAVPFLSQPTPSPERGPPPLPPPKDATLQSSRRSRRRSESTHRGQRS